MSGVSPDYRLTLNEHEVADLRIAAEHERDLALNAPEFDRTLEFSALDDPHRNG